MSHSRSAATQLTNYTSAAEPCQCGRGRVSGARIRCRFCKGCGKMMHSSYDEMAHQNHAEDRKERKP